MLWITPEPGRVCHGKSPGNGNLPERVWQMGNEQGQTFFIWAAEQGLWRGLMQELQQVGARFNEIWRIQVEHVTGVV